MSGIGKLILKLVPSISKIILLGLFLSLGAYYISKGGQLASSSLPSEPPSTLLKTLYNNGSQIGEISSTLTSNVSFVVGADISAQVEIGLTQAPNTSYVIDVMFPDAISYRDIPPYTWQQDWSYRVPETQILGTEQIQTLSNVTLVYAHEGIYGLNVTISHPSTGSEMHFYFYDLVQIKPLTYLEDETRSNLTFAMSSYLLGLAVIMVGPVLVQIVGISEGLFKNDSKRRLDRKTSAVEADEVVVELDPSNIRKWALRTFGEEALLKSVSKRAKYEFLLGKVVEEGYVGTFPKEVVWEGATPAWDTNYRVTTTKPGGEVQITSKTSVICQLPE
jgi:hypothetical protein